MSSQNINLTSYTYAADLPMAFLSDWDASANLYSWYNGINIVDSTGQRVDRCDIWGSICNSTDSIFGNQLSLAVCTLYPDVTRRLDNGTTDQRLTDLGFTSSASSMIALLQEEIPSCLMSYSAIVDPSNKTTTCTPDAMVASNAQLTQQGVLACLDGDLPTMGTTREPRLRR